MDIFKPRMKQEIEDCYAAILAPYATVKPMDNSRDIHEDNMDDDNRGSFQRDRDRIIHTKAFRRLMYKTQVFVNHEGDHFRTRLTHTIEVAQLARGVCKSLALNEDLTEAIAYGHDLGHTPFGHAVEEYFGDLLEAAAGKRFYHNEQSVRVVDYLEVRSDKEYGLNLTYEVREGILKHNSDRSGIYDNLLPFKPCHSLEGQVVGIVDSIAYICHDLEDGIISGIVERAMNQNDDIKRNLEELIQMVKDKTGIQIDVNPYREPLFIRKLIHYFIWQLTQDSWNRIKLYELESLDDVKKCAGQDITIIEFSKENQLFFKAFKSKIYQYIYGSRTIHLMDTKAVALASNMYKLYAKHPNLLPPDWYYMYEHIDNRQDYHGSPNSKVRVIIDYISTMTDRYALEENERLFNPSIKI